MKGLVRIFFIGMSASFLGSIPLGAINVAAMQIGMAEGWQRGVAFSAGALLVEMGYVRISLVAMDWVRKQALLFRIFEWVTLAIIVVLAVGSITAALSGSPERNVFLNNEIPRFLLGMVMRAMNPVLIPFWFGWSVVLLEKNVLLPRKDYYNVFIIGIGLGTLCAHLVFILGGAMAASSLKSFQTGVQWTVGACFSIMAIIHLWKMMTREKLSEQG